VVDELLLDDDAEGPPKLNPFPPNCFPLPGKFPRPNMGEGTGGLLLFAFEASLPSTNGAVLALLRLEAELPTSDSLFVTRGNEGEVGRRGEEAPAESILL